MSEAVAKQEINATKGTFEFRGIISNFDKNQEYESKTKKGNTMRTLVFNIDTAEGHSHRMQLRAYQSEKVYFSKTEVDKDGNRKNDVKEVKWNDRLKFNMEGYQPIDRVRFHNGKKVDESGKESRNSVSMLTFDSIPEINETLGRAIGNTMLSQYVQFFKQNFVTDNQIYRISGLEFVAFVTDYRKMDMLKNNLVNGEKMLHVHADYLNQKVDAEVFMGISRSDDLPSHKDTLKNAKEALKFASNPKFSSNFAFYKEHRHV